MDSSSEEKTQGRANRYIESDTVKKFVQQTIFSPLFLFSISCADAMTIIRKRGKILTELRSILSCHEKGVACSSFPFFLSLFQKGINCSALRSGSQRELYTRTRSVGLEKSTYSSLHAKVLLHMLLPAGS